MKASELLSEIEGMTITPETVKALAERVSREDLVGVTKLHSSIVAAAAARAIEVKDEMTMAGLMSIVFACGLCTTMEMVDTAG